MLYSVRARVLSFVYSAPFYGATCIQAKSYLHLNNMGVLTAYRTDVIHVINASNVHVFKPWETLDPDTTNYDQSIQFVYVNPDRALSYRRIFEDCT